MHERRVPGRLGFGRCEMQNIIEKEKLKIAKEMEKNRQTHAEAEEFYRDTGYDRYWNKMQRLDKEYDELKSFIGLDKDDNNRMLESENQRLYEENKKLKEFIKEAKSLMDYIHADYWSDPTVNRLHEKFKDFIN